MAEIAVVDEPGGQSLGCLGRLGQQMLTDLIVPWVRCGEYHVHFEDGIPWSGQADLTNDPDGPPGVLVLRPLLSSGKERPSKKWTEIATT